jgi:5-methylcytosine-specific restriction endonuclease McrA
MNPLCEDCEKEGIVTVATETHHKKKVRDYLALAFSVSNLMSLCESHHSIRTNRGE